MKIGWLTEGLLNLLFPVRGCPLCGTREGKGLCERCRGLVAVAAAEPFCPVCGRFFRGCGSGVCQECSSHEWPFVFSRAALPYEDVVRKAVHRLKFGGRRGGVGFLGELMAAVLKREPRYQEGEVLVPVPLSAERLRERGFNQAALLAAAVSERCGMRSVAALARRPGASSQAQLGKSARNVNVSGLFWVIDRGKVAGKTVVVVDDVLTTGSTMAAVASALRAAGAKQVFGLVLAAGRTFSHKVPLVPADPKIDDAGFSTYTANFF